MKSYRSLILVFCVSVALVTNAVAQSAVATTTTWYSSVLERIVASFTGGDDDCLLKICTACRPGDDCRPED